MEEVLSIVDSPDEGLLLLLNAGTYCVVAGRELEIVIKSYKGNKVAMSLFQCK